LTSATNNAVRTGAQRGWIEFKQSMRSGQDQGFYLFMAVAVLGYLFLNRNNDVEGTSMSYPAVAIPSILGAMVAFGMIIGPAYALAMEREDGTLLRAKAVPNGVLGHVVGHVVSNFLGLVPSFAVILIPGRLLFPDLMANGVEGWLTVLWVTVLGTLATLPIGLTIGSLVPGVQKVGTWGMLPFAVLTGISGIFFPIQSLWGWLQVVAQMFPLYWLGLGMRSAFLPDSAAALEIGGSWRTGWTVVVLGLWAVVGLAIVPGVLRRMARRQSGSAVEAAREQALQWVR
jgi:ABC-2 type transport system permease protein